MDWRCESFDFTNFLRQLVKYSISIHVQCSLYMDWGFECFDFTNFLRQYLSSIVSQPMYNVHCTAVRTLGWKWNNIIVTVLTRSQWVLDTTRDLKSFIVTLMASPFGITMAFLRSLVVSKTHWELVRTVTIVYRKLL